MLPEYVVGKSSRLSLKMKSSPLYNFSHIHDCPTNVVKRNIFSQVSPNDHQTSFSRFSEHADRFLHETFEMFFPRVTTTTTTKFIDDVTFFWVGETFSRKSSYTKQDFLNH